MAAESDERDTMDVPAPRPAVGITGRHLALAATPTPARLVQAIAAATLVHLLISVILLHLLGVAMPSHAGGTLLATVVVVSATAVVAVITSLRSRAHGLDWTTRTAPAVFGLLPPLASVLSLPIIALTGTAGLAHAKMMVNGGLVGLEAALPLVVAVLAATTAPGLAIALTLEQTLATLAARSPTPLRPDASEDDAEPRGDEASANSSPSPRRRRRLMPASLTGKLGRQAGGLALASCLLLLAHALQHDADPQAWLGHGATWLALLGTGTTVALSVVAAASAGLSPGRDVLSLSRRLDAIGWDEERDTKTTRIAHRRALADPVSVTSFDAVGELFANLERLRARLADDVRTYQRALDRTRAADAAKGEFLAAVSHELRTPLNSIMGFAQLLLETELNDSQIEDVRLILAGGRQLHDLIEDILDMSMIESGELDLRFAPADVCALVEELVDIHKAQVREGSVELRAELALYVPPIKCDRRRIGQ
ncbi:MAG: hypothetical protein KC431_13960, partial [Myxococcales bacterium]|nr:hypothetical protein [Myxococcales bacterium]